jgi:hypothetical protein
MGTSDLYVWYAPSRVPLCHGNEPDSPLLMDYIRNSFSKYQLCTVLCWIVDVGYISSLFKPISQDDMGSTVRTMHEVCTVNIVNTINTTHIQE